LSISHWDLSPEQRRKSEFGEPNEPFSDAGVKKEIKRRGISCFLSVPNASSLDFIG